MRIYITIDGGTTNTRINLVKDKAVIDSIKLNMGAKDNIESDSFLKNEIKYAIKSLLEKNSVCEDDVIRILASGMITSEFGLCHLEHIDVPAGIDELHKNAHEVVMEEISDIPFVFIRGVKIASPDFENVDMMRGEETELMGIINPDYKSCVYVLPGSHSKIIATDDEGRICNFSTMMTGEMIASLSQHTILKDTVDLSISEMNSEYLLKGYDYSKSQGINKALFKARILKNIIKCSSREIYSFFIGVVLCDEIEHILKSNAKTIVLGGKVQIKNAMAEILQKRTDKEIIILPESVVSMSTSLGAIKIFEN